MKSVTGPFNIAGITVYTRPDLTVGVILPSGSEVVMTIEEVLAWSQRLEAAVTRAEFETIVRSIE